MRTLNSNLQLQQSQMARVCLHPTVGSRPEFSPLNTFTDLAQEPASCEETEWWKRLAKHYLSIEKSPLCQWV